MKKLQEEMATAFLVGGCVLLPITNTAAIALTLTAIAFIFIGILGVSINALIAYKHKDGTQIALFRRALAGPLAAFIVHVLTLIAVGGSPAYIASFIGGTNLLTIVYFFTIPFEKAYTISTMKK